MTKRKALTFFSERTGMSRVPLARGVLTLLAALVLGIQALNYSASQAFADTEHEASPLTLSLTLGVALSFGIVLFFLVPLFLTKGLRSVVPGIFESGWFFNTVDGVIRLIIFLIYLWGISFSAEIRRVFQYHGAEHKSIFAFEAGDDLSVPRVKGYSYLHPRCGTNFLLIVMVVSVGIFALVPHHLPFVYKVVSRIILIPLIAGVSYEVIRFADRRRGTRSGRTLMAPGLWLQRLTAREPSDEQIEVAIHALKEVLEAEGVRERRTDV